MTSGSPAVIAAVVRKLSDNTVSGDMTLDLITDPIEAINITGYSIQAEYSGSPDGTLSIEVTNEDPSLVTSTWVELTDSAQLITSAGVWIYNVEAAFYGWARLRWVPNAGSGTLTATFLVKRF